MPAPIPWTFRGPLEGERVRSYTICNSLDRQTSRLDAAFACHIEEIGAFYVFFQDSNVCLYHVAQGTDVDLYWGMPGIDQYAQEGGCEGKVTGLIPVTESALAVLYEGTKCVLVQSISEAKWSVTIQRSWVDLDVNVRPKHLTEATLPTLNTSCQSRKLRGYGAEDFKIICEDGKELFAHSVVLASRWRDVHNILVENPEKRSLEVPFPFSWVGPVISRCYGKEPDTLDLVTATGVALAA